ncbi:cytochrome c oxidase accessory protein CcoG [bacterium]|nr:cytochrome c oxidase accessory protein CcoG [bacterium]
MTEIHDTKESFRDRIATVNESGKRNWVYPKKPKGRYHRARAIVAVFLLAFFFSAPFIKIGGHPLLLLDVINRKFVILGMAFWPQDFHIFVLVMLTVIVFIILFTVVYGRLWCGWACPQTIFMEMVYRKIEYLIEGDGHKQRKLNKRRMDFDKFFRKVIKHSVFYGIAFLISNTFLAYIIGVEQLGKIITDDPANHIKGLSSILIFSGVFYFVFAFFREQACTLVCPYGRFQGVLLDRDSIVVSYDYNRGEPRTKPKKAKSIANPGDCVDCLSCVRVCPTGIDIRNGTQLECVNCTACIDACDTVMEGLQRPRGLIRYASHNEIEEGVKKRFSGRSVGYSAVLVLLLGVISFMLLSRNDIETSILRTPGSLYHEREADVISNLYNLKIVNKTFDALPLRFVLRDQKGSIKLVGNDLTIAAEEVLESALFIDITRDNLPSASFQLKIDIYSGDELLETVKTKFMGPDPSAKESNG